MKRIFILRGVLGLLIHVERQYGHRGTDLFYNELPSSRFVYFVECGPEAELLPRMQWSRVRFRQDMIFLFLLLTEIRRDGGVEVRSLVSVSNIILDSVYVVKACVYCIYRSYSSFGYGR